MAASDVARRYFEALSRHDLDAAVACFAPGAVDRIANGPELRAPEGVRAYFTELFAAFPDFRLEVLQTTTARGRCAVQWRATGTFAGPGRYQGLEPNGERVDVCGCDVVTVDGDSIVANEGHIDAAAIATQLGFLPAPGSRGEQRLTRLANLRTRIASRIHASEPEPVADGVWLIRGGVPKNMNVYLIEEPGGGVTVFDAGIVEMAPAVRAAGARMGGIRRLVLGHADADHRGIAPGIAAPVYCHPAECDAAASESAFRTYFDLTKLRPPGPAVYKRLLPMWDGGPVGIEGTVSEGDEVAGFTVIELAGHAPGLIGLFRESDRLALVSDCVYTINPETGIKGPPRVPHPAFNEDTGRARESIRKLAALRPAAVWAGHANPVTGDVDGQLQAAAAAA
jgi:glyoxylase-like metal-dependent hydrolase (beta-lactamase superfamily II)/predicted ester cyclase